MLDVGRAGFFQHAGQSRLLLAHLRCPGPVLRRHVVFGHLQADLLSQVFHRLNKAHAGVFTQKLDRVAADTAAEAVVELFGGADAERWRFFAVEGAQPHEVGAALFKLNVAPDDVNDVGTCQQFLDE